MLAGQLSQEALSHWSTIGTASLILTVLIRQIGYHFREKQLLKTVKDICVDRPASVITIRGGSHPYVKIQSEIHVGEDTSNRDASTLEKMSPLDGASQERGT
jgi:hypothetical protein